MTDLTLFATTKPFEGHNGIIQRNALRSWSRLAAAPSVVLFGDEAGTAEIAQEIGATHVPDIRCNASGTPLISEMFAGAQRASDAELFCYLNADIVLFDHFNDALQRVAARFPAFVMIGRRVDLDVVEPLDFQAGWCQGLRARAKSAGTLSAATALDYFAYRRGVFDAIPDFAVGRPAWDAWMVMDTRRRGLPLVDATLDVTAVHQNHGYGHIRNASGMAWEGPEADQNRILARNNKPNFMPHLYNAFCANWLLFDGEIRRARSREYLFARGRMSWYDHGGQGISRATRRLAQVVRWPTILLEGSALPYVRRLNSVRRKSLEAAWVCLTLLFRRPSLLYGCIFRPQRLRKVVRRSLRVLMARRVLRTSQRQESA